MSTQPYQRIRLTEFTNVPWDVVLTYDRVGENNYIISVYHRGELLGQYSGPAAMPLLAFLRATIDFPVVNGTLDIPRGWDALQNARELGKGNVTHELKPSPSLDDLDDFYKPLDENVNSLPGAPVRLGEGPRLDLKKVEEVLKTRL